ncbi:helix-turn-helix domain-containing protein [Piscibacillus sp. B03]|uniref:helix-turn-helix domain-containing protein n=1 Tax=Piscibacillus sp. B03 TaxID=3457430 RepID=UPI003FCE5CBE
MSKGTQSAEMARETRKAAGLTQTQLGLETNYTREAISKHETGERSVSAERANHMASKYNDPRLGIETAHEYKGWGLGWLDGEALDTHRLAAVALAKKEMMDALEAIDEALLAKQPKYIEEFERQQIEDALVESAEAIAFLEFEIAKLCKDYNFKFNDIFSSAEQRLRAERLVK